MVPQMKRQQLRLSRDFAPFIIPDKNVRSNTDLCTTCRTIDFKRAYSLRSSQIPMHGKPIFAFSGFNPSMLQAHCPACRTFASMAYPSGADTEMNNHNNVQWHLRAFHATALYSVPSSPMHNVSIFVSLVSQPDASQDQTPNFQQAKVSDSLDSTLCEASWRRGLLLPHRLISTRNSNFGTQCHSIRIGAEIDYKRTKEMLAACSGSHMECKNYNLGQFPCGTELIDCATRKLVSIEPGMAYLALSYVWGIPAITNISLEARSREGGSCLPAKMPQTIEDAMLVVQRLGFSYLWVDRYCIDQHNNADKNRQINQMASIYSHAIATVCATSGDSNAGIYGVSRRRPSQHFFEHQEQTIIRCPWPEAHIREHLAASRWITRGWTYQEPLLSRTCLFFTAEGVIQVCHNRTFGESLYMQSSFTNRTVALNASLFDARIALVASTPHHNRYPSFIQEVQAFQRRHFSYDADALDAFRGILSTINMQSYWGVPILKMEIGHMSEHAESLDRNTGFLYGLLWHTVRALTQPDGVRRVYQRNEFPSWSWIGCRGALANFLHHGGDRKSSRLRSCYLSFKPRRALCRARLAIIDSEGQSMTIDNLLIYSGMQSTVTNNGVAIPGPKIAPERSKFIVITSVTAKWSLKNGYTRKPCSTGQLRKAHYAGVLLEHITDLNIQANSPQSKPEEIARIALDNGIDPCSTNEHTDQDTTSMRAGIAILLLISTMSPGPGRSEVCYTYWLAVRPLPDGTYQRHGMIECYFRLQGRKFYGYQPPEESLSTMRIG